MIHKTAIIDKNARIGDNVEVGPYCVIGSNVQIADNNKLYSHVNISGNTKIGEGNTFYPFCSIGNDPQDLKFSGEANELTIGKGNKIREYVTINPGTEGGGKKTIVGNNCLFMVSSHIAHDCIVGDNVVLANNVPLGGHAIIEDGVIIGGNSAVQQFTRIGRGAMIGGMCGVVRDIIPYGIALGNRSVLQGLNLIGLRRKNLDNKDIMKLSEAYKIIFKNENFLKNIEELDESFMKVAMVKEVVNFLTKDKKRPICTPFSK